MTRPGAGTADPRPAPSAPAAPPDLGDPAAPAPAMLAAAVAAIVIVGGLAYLNSFAGVFLFDDLHDIVANEKIRDFRHLWGDRPLVRLSLALNHRWGGLDAWGYHLVNLAVHLLAGVTLFGLVRRTLGRLRSPAFGPGAAIAFALAAALVWVVHPLQTQSVTYVIQRAESMTGLLYLLTLYCVVRGAASPRPRAWYAIAVLVCALGMGTKAVMATAPVVVLLYDRTFLSRSLGDVARRRWGLHAGLALTWSVLVLTGVLGTVLGGAGGASGQTAGAGGGTATALQYALTQPGVLLHYLTLAVWPRSLCLDLWWPPARSAAAIAGPGLVIAALLGATAWALVRRPWLGFLGASFFLVLGPTSSVVPLRDAAVEHRMYLPLAAVVIVAVAGVTRLLSLLSRRLALSAVAVRSIATATVVVAVAGGVAATVDRNRDYHDEARMWGDVLAKRPHNPRAHTQVGKILDQRGHTDEAIAHYEAALAIDADLPVTHNNLGAALARRGQRVEAIAHFRAAARLRPDDVLARNNLAIALVQDGRLDEAIDELRAIARLRPDDAAAHANLARGLARQLVSGPATEPGRVVAEMLAHTADAIRLDPAAAPPLDELAPAVARHGDLDTLAARYADHPALAPLLTRARHLASAPP